MKKLYAVLLILISLVSFSCQKEVSQVDLPGGQGNNTPDPVTASVQGNIVDENGAPAASVSVKVGNKSILTDSKGYFRIINASLDKTSSLVTAEKAGYFKAYRSFQATKAANHIRIKLTRRQLTGTISATGGEVSLSNGAKVALPANAVVKAAGGAYTGDIKVYAAYIDPSSSNIGAAVPGSFMADNASGERVTLASFGMLAVELESSSAEKLQIANGKEATLNMPIPASLQQAAPASISLWYVDEQTGIWKEDGKATRSGNNYIGTVKHFSFWNCDIGLPAVTLSLVLKNEKGIPLIHTSVRLKAFVNGAPAYAHGITDSLGAVSGLVPLGQILTLDVLNPECNNAVYSANVGPFTANTNLGTITINSVTGAIVTISGKLVNCDGAPVKNGSALIAIANSSSYVSTDQNGTFSLVYVRCSNGPQAITITGIDNANQQQGSPASFTLANTPEVDAGTLTACGISASQFVIYKVDGVEYTIQNQSVQDSLQVYTYQEQQPANSYITTLSAYEFQQSKALSLSFRSQALVPGTYPIRTLYVNQFGSVEPQASSTITVTKFPLAVGEFIEGTFAGQFRDSTGQDPIRTISGSFRLRKQ